MNEKITLFLKGAMSRLTALSKKAAVFPEKLAGLSQIAATLPEKLTALSKKQLVIAGGSVAAAAVLITVIAISGSGNDAGDLKEKDRTVALQTAYAIAVNGSDILYVPTEEDAKAVVDGIVAAYTQSGSVTEYAFEEEVTYQEKDIVTAAEATKNKKLAKTYVCQADEAVRYILNGTSTPLTYTVQGGDTLWDIALASNISVFELEQMNPGKFEKLSIGDTINLYQKMPIVNVVTTEVVTATENIPYSTSYTNSSALYRGQTKVQTAGVNGSKEIVTQIVKRNGYETGRTLLSEKVLSQPVTQIALAGTKAVPISTGSGTLQSPLYPLTVSSGFGASRGGGSRSHKGIDIRAAKGTAFTAADAGTVTFAGWSGGSYGYLVTVNHGNGTQTKYAHCNSVSVSVGDSVKKGQVLGTVGSTGNATGNVLHFEVVVNGVARNPLSYL